MNETKVRELINQVIEENKQRIGVRNHRKQYVAGVAQKNELESLGILHLMPAKFGFSDADAVIRAAKMSKSAAFNAAGEGDAIAAHPLYVAINEVDQVESSIPVEIIESAISIEYYDHLDADDIAEMDRVSEMENNFAEWYHADQQVQLERETDLQEAVDFDETLSMVMTSGEAVAVYNLSNSAVRQAIRDGAIPARKSGGTWLILRKHADELWSKRNV